MLPVIGEIIKALYVVIFVAVFPLLIRLTLLVNKVDRKNANTEEEDVAQHAHCSGSLSFVIHFEPALSPSPSPTGLPSFLRTIVGPYSFPPVRPPRCCTGRHTRVYRFRLLEIQPSNAARRRVRTDRMPSPLPPLAAMERTCKRRLI